MRQQTEDVGKQVFPRPREQLHEPLVLERISRSIVVLLAFGQHCESP